MRLWRAFGRLARLLSSLMLLHALTACIWCASQGDYWAAHAYRLVLGWIPGQLCVCVLNCHTIDAARIPCN